MAQAVIRGLVPQVLFCMTIDNKVPGAGKYEDIARLSGLGKYANSKYKGGTQAKFGNSKRKTFFDNAVRT